MSASVTGPGAETSQISADTTVVRALRKLRAP
jgi:hypothetical protein